MHHVYPYYESSPIENLRDMVWQKAATMSNKTAFSFYDEKAGIVRVSYASFAQTVQELGTFLHIEGYYGKHIAILAENSYEWLVTFMAIVNGGNVAVALDKELPTGEMAELIISTDIVAIFCSATYEAVLRNNTSARIYSFGNMDDMLRQGGKSICEGNDEFRRCVIDSTRCCCIFFTSGTSGEKKGVMLSHKNLAFNIVGSCRLFKLKQLYAVLPFHHAFGLITAVWVPFHQGSPVFLNKNMKRLWHDFSLAMPQSMMVVPLFVETLYKQIWEAARQNGNGDALTEWMRQHPMASEEKPMEILPGFLRELEYIFCGGAGLNPCYIQKFRRMGIEIRCGYGATECSPVVAANRNGFYKDGTVGPTIPDTRARISEEGEVLVAGDHVMLGYYKNEKATRSAVQDGWYMTGDLGNIDDDGFITLTGRKKNLIIFSNGENVSPEELEQKLLLIPGIDEVIVSGKDHVICAEIYAAEADADARAEIEEAVREINRGLPMYKRILNISFRDKEFEKTTSKKIKRG